MQEPWNMLSSPRHLVVFEAAARHGSFTKAAAELNVQQPAVSAAMKQLEASLGAALFTRAHKQIALTAAGKRLFADVTQAFEQLAYSARSVRQVAQSDYVTLSASSAFNNYWIMPRLSAFKQAHPDVDLRLQSSDREPDIDTENISLSIRRGDGAWSGCEAALIAPEVISPVASPRIMGAAINLGTVPNLLHERLIHLEEPIRDRPTWRDWFGYHQITGAVPQTGLRLNDYALVLQAAMAGEGFAFGWHHVTDRLIAQGLLAARQEWAWRTGQGFYLVWSKQRPLKPAALLVRDWILQVVAQDA